MEGYWHWSFYISAFYVVSIFALQRWMRDRKKFDLRRPLFLWSLTLSLFSINGWLVVGLPHVIYFYTEGWERSVCDALFVEKRAGLWSFMFIVSKLPELMDTYFIVLRKQKLIFLHWYHHITVFIYCWYHYPQMIVPSQWFITMNYFVHAIMYAYYAIRASGRFKPPLWVNMFITALQLSQMVIGVYVNIFVYNRMTSDLNWHCDGKAEKSYWYIYISCTMYFTYFVLFIHFFCSSYIWSKPRSPEITGSTIPNHVYTDHRNGNIAKMKLESKSAITNRTINGILCH